MESESSQCGPQEHPKPLPAHNRSPTTFERAIKALAPSGSRREIRALFGNRASWAAIQHWKAGRRDPPQWAIDCLRERVAPIMDLRPGPGTGTALIAWLKAHGRYPKKKKPPVKAAFPQKRDSGV
jgi:hypothetical protein